MLDRFKRQLLRLMRSSAAPEPHHGSTSISFREAVIVRFSGGLANQMTCYKLGRYVSDLKKCAFVIDANLYEKDDGQSNRNFQLLEFDISYDVLIASEGTMRDIKFNNQIAYITRESLPLPDPSTEQKVEVLNYLRNNDIIYCDFWLAMCLRTEMDEHAENSGVLDDLRLDPRRAFDDRDLACLDLINNTADPVAIHVRRGDFSTHDGNLLLTEDYYNRSIEAIESRIESPGFFVFSDDIGWCREHLRSRQSLYFVDWTDDRHAYKDMFLASSCRHFILSNESTFSHQIVQLSADNEGRIVMTSGRKDLMRNAADSASRS